MASKGLKILRLKTEYNRNASKHSKTAMTKTKETTANKPPFFVAVRDVLSGERKEFKGEPDDAVKEGEEVVGIISDPILRSLYCFARGMADEGKRIIETPIASAKHDEIHKQLEKLGDRIKLASRLFWISVNEQFPEAEKEGHTLSLRKNWQVVLCKDEEKPSLADLLGEGIAIQVPAGFFGRTPPRASKSGSK